MTKIIDGKPSVKVNIDDKKLLDLLESHGFKRLDIPSGFVFIQINDNKVKEVLPQNIQDHVSSLVRDLPEELHGGGTRHDLQLAIIRNSEKFFSKNRLSWLPADKKIIFNTDDKQTSYVYYKNGYVKCESSEYNFHEYSTLEKVIWQNQLIQRDFVKLEVDANKSYQEFFGYYSKFIWNVSGKDRDRLTSLMTLIGYLLHDFKEGKMKAVVLTDGTLNDGNNGRTGKTLLGKSLEKIRDVCELNGKEFRGDKSFKYQEANISTQIMFLNDARKNFDLEALYVDVTEGINIEKKNQSPVKIKLKYLITTNATIKTASDSDKDRVTEFEFSNHYSANYSPEMEFGHWFFRDWSSDEWNLFDNFMMTCLALYLENGIIEANQVNLKNRKLIDQTCKQFYDFIESKHVEPYKEFCLQDLLSTFESIYPEYDFKYTKYPSRTLSKWLKLLPDLYLSFSGLKMEPRKSNGNTLYTFKS